MCVSYEVYDEGNVNEKSAQIPMKMKLNKGHQV